MKQISNETTKQLLTLIEQNIASAQGNQLLKLLRLRRKLSNKR
jgi:hypothetical protein